jgi:hypothetical protein
LTPTFTAAEGRWETLDKFLQATPSLRPIRARFAELLDEVRAMGDYGLAEEIEAVGHELRTEMLDRAILWAFELGRLAGRREARRRS